MVLISWHWKVVNHLIGREVCGGGGLAGQEVHCNLGCDC